MTKVSIIIPCYNQARFLPDCIASLQAQIYPHWEAIIVNDGSSDDTREVALKLCEGELRLRYIEQENRGLSGARNRGIQETKGDFIQFLDSDDLLHPEKLQRQLEALQAQPGFALSFCDYYFCDAHDIHRRVSKGHDFEHPRLHHLDPLIDLALRWETDLSIPAHCFLFDARLLRDNDIQFDENLPNHEDWDCWMRIFRLRPRIIHVASELVIYRQHPSSMTADRQAMWHGYAHAIRKQLDLFQNDRDVRKALKQKLKQMRIVYLGNPLSPIEKASQLYRNIVPWPIQVFLRKLASRPDK